MTWCQGQKVMYDMLACQYMTLGPEKTWKSSPIGRILNVFRIAGAWNAEQSVGIRGQKTFWPWHHDIDSRSGMRWTAHSVRTWFRSDGRKLLEYRYFVYIFFSKHLHHHTDCVTISSSISGNLKFWYHVCRTSPFLNDSLIWNPMGACL